MGVMLRFEIKKIVMKKSTIAALVILFAMQVFSAIADSLGSVYVNDVFWETHAERHRIDREYGIALSGRAMDDELLAQVQEAYGKMDWSNVEYLRSDLYKEEVRPYENVITYLMSWFGSSILTENQLTEAAIYGRREQLRDSLWEYYELSDREKAYWQAKDAEVGIPFTYEYAAGYDSLTGMQGMYMTCMLMTFFIGVSMVTVFADEHTRKTDQLILSTRYGKGKAYFAKILAGSLVVFGVNVLFTGTLIAGKFFSYGAEGFGAAIQLVWTPWYSYPLTIGQAFLLMTGILLLSSVMTAVFAMLLAELLENSVGAMAIVVGLLFAARLVPVPLSLGVLSQAWNYLPINLLKMDEGFMDLRTVNLFGLQLTSWQAAPVLYAVLTGVMVFAGSRLYRRYQVSGR